MPHAGTRAWFKLRNQFPTSRLEPDSVTRGEDQELFSYHTASGGSGAMPERSRACEVVDPASVQDKQNEKTTESRVLVLFEGRYKSSMAQRITMPSSSATRDSIILKVVSEACAMCRQRRRAFLHVKKTLTRTRSNGKNERERGTRHCCRHRCSFSSLLARAFLARAWLVEPPGRHLPKSIEVQHPSEKSREKPWMTSLRHGDLRALGSRVRFAPKVFPGLPRRKMDRKQRLTSQFMARELFRC